MRTEYYTLKHVKFSICLKSWTLSMMGIQIDFFCKKCRILAKSRLRIAVITVELVGEASFVYSWRQTRLMIQYNGKWPIKNVSANQPYLQPEGWIAKGAAQQDRPNACERRLIISLVMASAKRSIELNVVKKSKEKCCSGTESFLNFTHFSSSRFFTRSRHLTLLPLQFQFNN